MAELSKKRICKKCLLRDLAVEDQKNIQKYIEVIKEQDRTEKAVYEKRLAICLKCEKLQEATCQACGCYVEIRAALKQGRCPYKKWEQQGAVS